LGEVRSGYFEGLGLEGSKETDRTGTKLPATEYRATSTDACRFGRVSAGSGWPGQAATGELSL
jgi:hypothetical protein